MVFAGAIQKGQLWMTTAFLACAVLTILYLFRAFNLVFLGEAHGPTPKEGSRVMVFSVALFAALSLLGGIFISYPYQFVQAIVNFTTSGAAQ